MYGYEITSLLESVDQLFPHFRGITTIDTIKQLRRAGDFLIVNTE